jgi:organic radical activating enzyme
MNYPVAERFKALQGEGVYTGVPMAFIRMVGCSVGKKICTSCDTDFDTIYPHLDGGTYNPKQLLEWVGNYRHLCVTGGEPMMRDLMPLWDAAAMTPDLVFHVETSGTQENDLFDFSDSPFLWICVSPKPGFKEELVAKADEVKVIYGGLGNGPGWPGIADAMRWAAMGKIVYLQPRNNRITLDQKNTMEVVELVKKFPMLRASIQLHKVLGER